MPVYYPNVQGSAAGSFADGLGRGFGIGSALMQQRRQNRLEDEDREIAAEERRRRVAAEEESRATAAAGRRMEAHERGWDTASDPLPRQVYAPEGTRDTIDLPRIETPRPYRASGGIGAALASEGTREVGAPPVIRSRVGGVEQRPAGLPSSITQPGDVNLDGTMLRRNPARLAAEADLPQRQRREGIAGALQGIGTSPELSRAYAETGTAANHPSLARRSTGMTQAERVELERMRQQGRERLEAMRAAGRGNSAEAREISNRLREIELDLRIAQLEAGGLDAQADDAERAVGTGTNRIVNESLPGGKERVGEAERRAGELRGRAAEVRTETATRARERLGTGRPNPVKGKADSTKTKPTMQQRVDQLRGEGKTKEQARAILKREGYIK